MKVTTKPEQLLPPPSLAKRMATLVVTGLMLATGLTAFSTVTEAEPSAATTNVQAASTRPVVAHHLEASSWSTNYGIIRCSISVITTLTPWGKAKVIYQVSKTALGLVIKASFYSAKSANSWCKKTWHRLEKAIRDQAAEGNRQYDYACSLRNMTHCLNGLFNTGIR